MGSIFRTADAAGVSKIWLCGITPAPLDRFGNVRPDFAKVSLGAEGSVPWESAKDTEAVVRNLKEEGWCVFALEQSEGSVPYDKISVADGSDAAYCLILGSEVEGLPSRILELADAVIEIPMFGKKESLNVSVAFGIAVFAFKRA